MSKYDQIYINEDEKVISIGDVKLYNAVNDLQASDWKTIVEQSCGWDSSVESSNISMNELVHKVEELEAAVEDLESRLDILLKNNSKTSCSNSLEEIEKYIKKYQCFND